MVFRVGQKVVCIYDKGQGCPPFVKVNEVYTIASMRERWIGTCLEFVELDTSKAPTTACFPAKYFRPVTSISTFTDMLSKVKEDA